MSLLSMSLSGLFNPFSFSLILICLLVTSCGHYKDGRQEVKEVDGNEIGFRLMKSEVFNARCIQCHAEYKSYETVLSQSQEIRESVRTNRMPKSGTPLTPYQKSLIYAWIDAGSPRTPGSGPGKMKPLGPTWESVGHRVVLAKCAICHQPGGDAEDLDFSSRQSIFENRNFEKLGMKLIDFDNPEASYLAWITQDEIEPMPPEDSNVPRVSKTELDSLIEWIRRGLP